MQSIFSIFVYLLRLAFCPNIWSILKKVWWNLRGMNIVWMLDEIFCRCHLGPFDLWCDLVLEFLWFFVWMTYLLEMGAVLKSTITTMLDSICDFKCIRLCLMKLGALSLGSYRVIIVISFCCIPLFDQCRFEVYFVWCKYCYSCLLSGTIGLASLLPAFHPKSVLVSVNKWVSCKQ
jgi:hypothetical protein